MTNKEISKDSNDAPVRKIYYIDFGDLVPDQAVAELEKIKSDIEKEQSYD